MNLPELGETALDELHTREEWSPRETIKASCHNFCHQTTPSADSDFLIRDQTWTCLNNERLIL